MKKFALTAIVAAMFSTSALAVTNNALGHDRYSGVYENFNTTITDKNDLEAITGYLGHLSPASIKLNKIFKENGEITPQDLKDAKVDAHHLYTGYLAGANNQAEYDKRLKELLGSDNNHYQGEAIDNLFVSNRDMKAHGSMLMNQVEERNQIQNTAMKDANDKQDVASKEAHDSLSNKLDNVTSGLQQLGNHVADNTGTGGEGSSNQAQVDKNTTDIGTNAGNIETNKDNITTNSNNIQAMGDAFVGRVDTVNGYLEQVGNAIKNTSNAGLADRMDTLEGAFAAQAEHTAQEIGRLDGRIDELEKKTDKMKAGVAGATAIATLTQYHGQGNHHIAVGVGGYDGESALAAGYTYAFDDKRTTIRATLALDSQDEVAVGASIGHSW